MVKEREFDLIESTSKDQLISAIRRRTASSVESITFEASVDTAERLIQDEDLPIPVPEFNSKEELILNWMGIRFRFGKAGVFEVTDRDDIARDLVQARDRIRDYVSIFRACNKVARMYVAGEDMSGRLDLICMAAASSDVLGAYIAATES